MLLFVSSYRIVGKIYQSNKILALQGKLFKNINGIDNL